MNKKQFNKKISSKIPREEIAPPLPVADDGKQSSRKFKDIKSREGGQDVLHGKDFAAIRLLLRDYGDVDFISYKPSVIRRHIIRRMVFSGKGSLDEYVRFLQGNAKEVEALYTDILTVATRFFRNPEAFTHLKEKVFSALTRPDRDGLLRVWVVGCSSGQEAYSLAILMQEFFSQFPGALKFQIFASDLSLAHIEEARAGFYPKAMMEGISRERLHRFFIPESGGYRVSKALRETVIFARQNIFSDPPLSQIDLISCRNVLTYLEGSFQQSVMSTFHYALRPGGFLFLGKGESVGPTNVLFEPLDKKSKIYTRKSVLASALKQHFLSQRSSGNKQSSPPASESPRKHSVEINQQREADRLTIERYSPPGILVDAELNVLQIRGDTSNYLNPPAGKVTFNLMKMADEGLRFALRVAIRQALQENRSVRRDRVMSKGGGARPVNIIVIPLKTLPERGCLILFEEAESRSFRDCHLSEPSSSPALAQAKGNSRDASLRRRIVELEQLLAEKRNFLELVQDSHAVAVEELQTANEELQTANEELESTNEELESSNEEMMTVNEEMAGRNAELRLLNSDLNNLQISLQTAILVLSRELIIRRFTASAQTVFNLIPADIGRSLREIRYDLELPDLEDLILDSIKNAALREREVRDKSGRWYILRVRPYLTLENKIEGAVLVLTDVDALKRSEQELEQARQTLETRVNNRTAALREANVRLRNLSTLLLHAQEDERRRVARELHDEIGQSLTSLKIYLARTDLASTPGAVGYIQEIVADTIQEVRELSANLRPQLLEDLGLEVAIQWHCRTFHERTNIKVVFDFVEFRDDLLTEQQKISFYRAVQESLTNAAKHARVCEVLVRLQPHKSGIRLEVHDSGRGFKTAETMTHASSGLSGMRERVILGGGRFRVFSAPGKGTHLFIWFPINVEGDSKPRRSGGQQP